MEIKQTLLEIWMDFHAQYKRNCFCFHCVPVPLQITRLIPQTSSYLLLLYKGTLFLWIGPFIQTKVFFIQCIPISIGFLSKKEGFILVCRINMVTINDMGNKHSPAHFQVNIPSTQRNQTKKNMYLYLFSFSTANLKNAKVALLLTINC